MNDASIQLHPAYGPAMPSHDWVPAPRYLLRRDRVQRHMKRVEPCRVLDIGCGPATLLSELANDGFDAFGVDRAEQALVLASKLNAGATRMHLQAELDPDWVGSFDMIFSFEVIEHLEDDIEAMRDWRRYLKPGGRMLLSTPAHPKRWNAADEWAGHVRRYERAQLERHIRGAGFVVEKIECYGFPLANIMELWRARAYGKQMQTDAKADKDDHTLTGESGSDRSVETRFWKVFSSAPAVLAMKAACQIQRPFLQTDFGNGFFVVARAD